MIQNDRHGIAHDARIMRAADELLVDGESRGRVFLGSTVPARRFAVAGAAICLGFMLLLGRVAQLQLIRGGEYAGLAESNRVRSYTLVPPRGIVSDRFGITLIQNVPSFQLTLTVADLPKDPTEREDVLTRAAELGGVARTDIDLLLPDATREPYEPFVLREDVPYEAAMRLAIEESSLPGFRLADGTIRSYPAGLPGLSHALGYVGTISSDEYAREKSRGYRAVDQIGKTGIERAEEDALRGTPGSLRMEVDARGKERSVADRVEPVAGKNLVLSIDAEFQRFVESRVNDALVKLNVKKGAVVAIDPRDGSVRAMASFPTFDSNAFAGGIDAATYASLISDENQPLFHRAVSGEYPPGSTFKPYVAYTALADGLVGASTSFVSTGGLRIGQWFFPDWKPGGHGVTDVRSALAWSVNTYFYIVGGGFDTFTGLGVERISEGARLFGFGSVTGIRLPGEGDGFLPSKEWKEEAKGERWYVGDTYHLSIGQGDMLATPLQVAVANATIANGGSRYVPTLLERVGDSPVEAVSAADPLDATAVQVVREGMRKAVTEGSARFLAGLAEPVAGKTGTAQASGDVPTHAWFEGFGPYDNPTISIVILIENGGEGSSVAVPIARDLFEWWFANRPNE